jgi:hypothetical protein
VFGLVNAVLYCLLLPLWEGFDEPFHYGYVQTLAVRRELPALGKTPVSEEILRSLELAPASHVVRRNLPFVTTFGEFAALPEPARRQRREDLRNLPVGWREVEAQGPLNYEAQQAPLAYLPLAAVDHLWRQDPLLARVLKVRLTGALAACLLQFWLTLALARELGLSAAMRCVALFLIFSCQMFYAATARVANDWLAIPLTTLVVIAALKFFRTPGWRAGALLGSAVAAGLLTKAYFLPWALFAGSLVVWLVLTGRATLVAAGAVAIPVAGLAGPWYLRNLLLYGSVSGMQQSVAGIGPAQAFRAALDLPWPQALLASARGAVWTGNSSFTSFSSTTVGATLGLALAGAGAWWWTSRKAPDRRAEWLVAMGCLCFFAAMLYANALFYAFTKGGIYTATPWYAQTLAAPLACLVSLGFVRAGVAGRLIGSGLCLVSAYLIGATYVVKLIPMYGGYGEGSMKAARLLRWYWQDSSRWRGVLADTAPGDAGFILALTAIVALMSAGICAALCLRLFRREGMHE